jgi:uncharacterized protein (TIGR04442 family)
MLQDIRLHGQINPKVTFYATVAGAEIGNRFFHETAQREGRNLERFFSSGNEFLLTDQGVSYRGNGGSFCEHMFGVEQPPQDLRRPEIRNRLILYGAYYAPTLRRIVFTNDTEGHQGFDQVFLHGHAICNYFFFLHWDRQEKPRTQQEEILKHLGRLLKRSPSVGRENDARIAREILDELRDPRAVVFLFRLIHRPHQAYRDAIQEIYARERNLGGEDLRQMEALAHELELDLYQQERIKIDVISKHQDNIRIVEEYRETLLGLEDEGPIRPADMARMHRLRTLGMRNAIPLVLFDSMDAHLLREHQVLKLDEPEYLTETRAILQHLFLSPRAAEGPLPPEDLIRLIKAKQQATALRDASFELLLLDACRTCDEKAQAAGDERLLEQFGTIVAYLDRYDSAANFINRLALIEGAILSEEHLRSLLGSKREFEKVKPGLFREVFIDPLRRDPYLTRYGRKKLEILKRGLDQIEEGIVSLRDLAQELGQFAQEERVTARVQSYLKARIKSTRLEHKSRQEQDAFIQGLANILKAKRFMGVQITNGLIEGVLLDLKKESLYLNTILPKALASKNRQLREDFLQFSGLDRFYIEELEREYCETHQIPMPHLEQMWR